MGITGLLPFIKNSCRPANISDFKGCTVAVDAYGWLHKGVFSCAEKIVKGEKTDGYVYYCKKQINLLVNAGLKPILVFDGCNLESKAVTEKKRRENREKTRQKGKEFLAQGKIKEARECFQRCIDVTPEMAADVIQACNAMGVDCIVAPYEADAQLAYLNKVNIAHFIITEDSDLVVFGCSRILFKLDSNGGGLLYEKENLPKSFGVKAEKMSFEKFRYMCILSGCDYLPSLPGIGLAKALKFLMCTINPDIHDVLPKLPSYLYMSKLTVTQEYRDSFMKANNTFLYQLVFCPKKKELVPLNPYPEDMDTSDLEYAGKYLPADTAIEIAMGRMNVKNMTPFDLLPNQSEVAETHKRSIWCDNSFDDQTQTKKSSSISGFQFKRQSCYSSSPPKKKSRLSSQIDENVDIQLEDDLLILAYSSEKSPIKKESPKKMEETPEQDVKREEEEENKKSRNPFRKVLSPTTTNVTTQNPFRRIVKSRFFTDSISTPKPLKRKSLLDAIEEEYKIANPEPSIDKCGISVNDSNDKESEPPAASNDESAINSSTVEEDDDDVISFDFDDFKSSNKDISGYGECNSFQESFGNSQLSVINSQDSDLLSRSLTISFPKNSQSSSFETTSSDDRLDTDDSPVVVDISESPKKIKVVKSPYFNEEEDVDDPDVLISTYSEKVVKKPAKPVPRSRSVGLPKNRRKSEKQMTSLFNFNFTRHISVE